jgi:hypothetical protein
MKTPNIITEVCTIGHARKATFNSKVKGTMRDRSTDHCGQAVEAGNGEGTGHVMVLHSGRKK